MIPGLPQIGATELLIILFIVLLLFGAKRIPQLARSLGTGTREFRSGIAGAYDAEEDAPVEHEQNRRRGEAAVSAQAPGPEDAPTAEQHAG